MECLTALPLVLSYLQINDYNACPKRFNHRWIAKDCPQEQKSYAQSGGIKEHDALRKRLKLDEPLPPEYVKLEPICSHLVSRGDQKHVELALGCTIDGRPCGFSDDSCRLRTRIDLCLVRAEAAAVIVDWKTGKPWEDPLELRIQALLLKIHHPHLQFISAFYFWLKENRPGPIYEAIDAAETWQGIVNLTKSIKYRIDNNSWPPDEGPLCGWCPVTKEMCSFKRDRK